MLAFLEASNNTNFVSVPGYVGLRAYFTLVDTLAVAADIVLAADTAALTDSEGYSYVRVTTKQDAAALAAIMAFIGTAELKITLVMLASDGTEYTFREEYRPISEYRIDEGPSSISVTFASRRSITDASGRDVTISRYTRKTQNIVDTETEYTYGIDPLLYKNIGIGKRLVEGSVGMAVNYKTLVLKDALATLTVKGVV